MRLLFFIFSMSYFLMWQHELLGQNYLNYQTVVFDENNRLVIKDTAGLEISILQGSMNGPIVFQEQHQKMTNANGLLTVEIGNGNLLFGEYDMIDWSSGPYYLKSEIDPEGGTNYIMPEVTQMLSVPFALHAKTVETERDLVFSASAAKNITLSHITGLDSLSGTNTGDQVLDSFATKEALKDSIAQLRNEIPKQLIAGANITISGDTISASLPKKPPYLGQDTLGGIVFHLYYDSLNQLRGLVLYPDLYPSKQWQNNTTVSIDARRSWDGAYNTSLLSNDDNGDLYHHLNFFNTHSLEPYHDWYIPSIDELHILWQNRLPVNQTLEKKGSEILPLEVDQSFWSSTEYQSSRALTINFFNGEVNFNTKTEQHSLTLIRSF